MSRQRSGFSLVELLVVIAIIGILVSLILPAVQAARESARRTQCGNNLKQLATGALQHEGAHLFFPTGGWGWAWAGDPDLGYGWKQPGGWHYNILPYIGQQDLHDFGTYPQYDYTQSTMATNSPKAIGIAMAVSTVLPDFVCPSRREARQYPFIHGTPNYADAPTIVPNSSSVGRSDYAANGGDAAPGGISNTVDSATSVSSIIGVGQPSIPTSADGIVYLQAQLTSALILDGQAFTFLAGEKYLCPDHYDTGQDNGDDQGWNLGYDFDTVRWTGTAMVVPANKTTAAQFHPIAPVPDTLGACSNNNGFGGPHTSVVMMSFCDGSVRPIAMAIDPNTFQMLGNRQDQQVLDTRQFQ